MLATRRTRSTSRATRVGVPMTMSSICEIRSSVCERPRSNSAVTSAVASWRVMRPRSTASSAASCTRSRVSTTTSRGSRKRASWSRTPALSLVAAPPRARDVELFLRLVWRACGISARTLLDCSSSTDEQLDERLLGVAAVLGLLPDALALAVEHGLRDLLTGVGGQAVQRDRARGGAVEQRVVETVGRERLAALRGRRVVIAHRDPDVR